MNIQGSMLTGKQVDIDIAGDLTIQSDKTSTTYRQKNAGIGVGIALDTTHGSAGKGHVDYRLETVREQAGIFAGIGGVNIRVGGTTTLTGALIDSTADKDKNRITTKELEMKNLTNSENLTDQGAGIGWSDAADTAPNEQGLIPYIPIAGIGKHTSTTYAAIIDGKLRITGAQDFNTDDVNRNTQESLNALESTLDLQAMAEKKRLSELFAKHANEAVHTLSDKNNWQDGSVEKVLLHAVVGGITAKIGGDHYSAGAWIGAVNEVVNGEIAKYEAAHGKIDPALHQWLSATVGVIVARATGQTLQTGAAEAVYGTKWNDLAFQKEPLKIIYKRPWVSEDGTKTLAGHLYISDGVTTLGVTPDFSNRMKNYVEEKHNGEFVNQLVQSGDAVVVATVSVDYAEKAIQMINESLHTSTQEGDFGRYNFNVQRTYWLGGTCIDYGSDVLKMLRNAGIPVKENIPLSLLLPFEAMGNKVAYSIDEWIKQMDVMWTQFQSL